jgi:CubicO group peptidase (beta-lactamase class C family)
MSIGGWSRARLDRMRAIMAGHVARGTVPGLVTLVWRRGEAHVEALGVQAVGGRAPMRRDTIFRIASMTKPVVAVAAMILVEECRLRLDEPVDRLLPELANRRVLMRLDGPLDDTVPAQRPISLRDLLTLRMGFGFILGAADEWPIQRAMHERGVAVGPEPIVEPPEVWLANLGTLPLLRQPGEAWMYDTAADVLGVLVERAAGQPLEAFLRERIFEPLGMKDTGFSVPADKLDRLATCYHVAGAPGELAVFDAAAGGHWSRPPAFPSAAGGLVSTVDDYLAFGQMLLNKGRYGRERILSRPAVEVMTTDQLTAEQRTGAGPFLDDGRRGWGFGLSTIIRRDELAGVPGRFGWEGGYGTSWASDPSENLVAILMTQVVGFPGGIYDDFWTGVYQAIDD